MNHDLSENDNIENDNVPSFAIVNETCIATCKSMKGLSRQLMLLSASYQKGNFSTSGVIIYRSLLQIMESVRHIQDSLEIAAKSMNFDIDSESDEISFPDSFVITTKEYAFLNSVLAEYTSIITSKPFSLFSSQLIDVDLHREINTQCPDNEEKLKTN